MIGFRNLQIAQKMGIMNAIVILFFSIFSGIIFWTALSSVLKTELDERGSSLAAELSSLSMDAILSGDYFALMEIIHITKKNNSFVSYIFVVDAQNHIMAHTFQKGIPKNLLLIHSISEMKEGEADFLLLKTDKGIIHDILYPIEDGMEGYIRIGINEESMHEILMQNILKLVLLTILSAVVGAILIWRFTSILTFPLKKLTIQAEKISKGEFSSVLIASTNEKDEVHSLIRAINRMSEELDLSERDRKRLLGHLLTAQEDERKRIARELHDESGQALTALLFAMRALANQTEDSMQKEYILEVRNETAAVLDKLRNLAVELRPPALDELGIQAALEKLLQEYGNHYKISINFIYHVEVKITDLISLAIYRIVQESMTNIIKHSQATKAEICLMDKNGLLLYVKDNGIGITNEMIVKARKENHLGIYGIQERIQILGGSMEITTEKPYWTTVLKITFL